MDSRVGMLCIKSKLLDDTVYCVYTLQLYYRVLVYFTRRLSSEHKLQRTVNVLEGEMDTMEDSEPFLPLVS